MRRVAIAVLSLVFVLSLAAPAATAATPSPKRMAAQIRTLQKQVKALQRQVTQARQGVAAALVYGGCLTAATADAFQGTWSAIDTQKPPAIFGPQTQVNDHQLCQTLGIRRAPNQATTAVFGSLLQLFA
jgi:hypothetical protein